MKMLENIYYVIINIIDFIDFMTHKYTIHDDLKRKIA
jgi:hypothetical protein